MTLGTKKLLGLREGSLPNSGAILITRGHCKCVMLEASLTLIIFILGRPVLKFRAGEGVRGMFY